MLEESRKECKWVRERNQELERVVEALRKTIMRQAEISSQRPDQQQGELDKEFVDVCSQNVLISCVYVS